MAQTTAPFKKNNYDHLIKLLLIGDSGVGKSSVLLRYHYDAFEESFISTIGIDFQIKQIVIDNIKIKLQVWDTAGQDRFRAITTSYYRGAHGIIMIYDITDEESFLNISHWICNIERYADKDCCAILMANKADLKDDRKVVANRGEFVAQENGMQFYEASAKDDINITDTFHAIIRQIISKKKMEQQNHPENFTPDGYRKPVSLTTKKKKKKTLRLCCFGGKGKAKFTNL